METRRNDYLVSKKFYDYVIPSFLSELAMHAGIVIDSIIVGNLIGVDALTAVSLANPVIQILYIPGLILGLGGSTIAAIFLGERKLKEASNIFSACIIVGVIFSIIAALSAFFISEPLAYFLADNPRFMIMVKEYLFVNILGLPILSLSLLTCEFMSVDNNPDLGAWMFGIAAVTNIVFDFVFIEFFDMGIRGAAVATIVSIALGLIPLIFYAKADNRMLNLHAGGFDWVKNTYEALKIGLPRISSEVMQALQICILNTAVLQTLGAQSMNIYAICTNTLIMAELLVGGIISVIPNICGVLYGEKDYFAIRQLMKKVVCLSSVLVFILTAIFFIFPEEIAVMFGMNDEKLLPTAATCLKIYSVSFIFYAFNEFLQVYYQTILETMLATLDTALEIFVLLIPITFLLMNFYGIYGVCAAVAISEILTIIIIESVRKIQQNRGKLPQEGLLMIPKPEHDDSLDFSIEANEKNVIGISEKIMGYCREKKVDEHTAYILGLLTEEIAVNISRHGYEKNNKNSFIDINLSQDGENWILRIRDDGIPFNPTKYTPEEEGKFLLGGIGLIKKLAKNFTYTRVLNMNNTVIEV